MGYIFFPITRSAELRAEAPTFSPGERANRPPSQGHTRDGVCQVNVLKTPGWRRFYPLPEGWSLPTSRIAGRRCRLGRMGRPLPGCPEGTNDNSPAFQRWVSEPEGNESRQGRQKVFRSWHVFFRPSWAPTCLLAVVPAMNRWAIIRSSLRDSWPGGWFPGVKTPGYSQDVPPGQGTWRTLFPSSKQPDSLPMPRSFRRHGVQPGRCGTPSAPRERIRVRGNDDFS